MDVEFDVTNKQWHFISINDRNVYEFPQSTRRSCTRTWLWTWAIPFNIHTPPYGRVFLRGPPLFGVISEGYTLYKWFSEGLVIFTFSEGCCLTNTDSPFTFSHYAKKSKSGNKGRRYFSSQPLLALFFRLYWGKPHIVKTVGLISRYPERGFQWAFIMVTNEVFLAWSVAERTIDIYLKKQQARKVDLNESLLLNAYLRC